MVSCGIKKKADYFLVQLPHTFQEKNGKKYVQNRLNSNSASEFQYNTTGCTLFYSKVFIFNGFLEINLGFQFHERSSTALYIHISILHLFCGEKFLRTCYANLFEGVVNMRLEAVTLI